MTPIVTANEGYSRLQGALCRCFMLRPQKAVPEARKEAGFRAEQTADGWVWVRNKESANTLSSSNTTITT